MTSSSGVPLICANFPRLYSGSRAGKAIERQRIRTKEKEIKACDWPEAKKKLVTFEEDVDNRIQPIRGREKRNEAYDWIKVSGEPVTPEGAFGRRRKGRKERKAPERTKRAEKRTKSAG